MAMVDLYTSAQSREIDARAIRELGVSGFELMSRAADFAFATLLQRFSGSKRVSVWCGKGNNAGDAYLVAARARRFGMGVQLVAVADPQGLAGDAALAYQEARASGLEATGPAPPQGDVVVDGLLGTGVRGAPREAFSAAIEAINASAIPVLALDLPSGVGADDGAVPGAAIQAAITTSFITRKIGAYTGRGVAQVGERAFDDLGVPEHLYTPGLQLASWHAGLLPPTNPATYKHRQGNVVVVGGDESMPGAVAMAAEAALRVGAGLVTVVTRPAHRSAIVARTPEVMVRDAGDEDAVTAVLTAADVVICGPGLGRTDWGARLFAAVQASRGATVLDADGLFHLAQARTQWSGGSLAITPHSGEAGALLGESDLDADRLGAAARLGRLGCAGVLKGPGSVLFDGEDVFGICAHGNPGMATAGMGDVLAGMLGGLWAERLASAQGENLAVGAARRAALHAAVCLHSAAADAAASARSMRSLVATDVIATLPVLFAGEAAGDVAVRGVSREDS